MSASKAPRRRTGGLLLEFAMIILGALLALALARVYEVAERSEERRNNVSLATIQTNFRDGVRYIRLQQEANIAEVQTADTLLPLIADARDRLDAVKQP